MGMTPQTKYHGHTVLFASTQRKPSHASFRNVRIVARNCRYCKVVSGFARHSTHDRNPISEQKKGHQCGVFSDPTWRRCRRKPSGVILASQEISLTLCCHALAKFIDYCVCVNKRVRRRKMARYLVCKRHPVHTRHHRITNIESGKPAVGR